MSFVIKAGMKSVESPGMYWDGTGFLSPHWRGRIVYPTWKNAAHAISSIFSEEDYNRFYPRIVRLVPRAKLPTTTQHDERAIRAEERARVAEAIGRNEWGVTFAGSVMGGGESFREDAIEWQKAILALEWPNV